MKTNQWQSKIGVAILTISFVFGIAVLSVRAQAQNPDDRYSQDRNRDGQSDRRGRDWDRYGNYGGSSELRQTALNAGYNEGLKDGRRDRMNGRHARYQESNVYRRATQGYNSRLGDQEVYRRYFREGYENGYSEESYARGNRNGNNRNRDRDYDVDRNRNGGNADGYGNFGGSFQLRQTALNAGFNEGVKQGRSDRKNHNDRGYQGQNTYQNATKDYSSRLGDREVYQRYFREAYENGYADGISGY